jgi:hypothetical protein
MEYWDAPVAHQTEGPTNAQLLEVSGEGERGLAR